MGFLKNNWYRYFWFSNVRMYLFFVVGCLLISSGLGYFIPKSISNLSSTYSDKALFEDSMIRLACLFVGIYINRACYQLFINKYVMLVMANIRSICFENWLIRYEVQTSKKDIGDRYPQGEVISRIINDTEAIRELITSGTFGIFIDLFFIVSCMIGFIDLNSFSGLIITGAEVGVGILLIWGSRFMREVFHSVRKSRGMVQRTLANIVGGARETYYQDHHDYASKKGRVVFEDFLTKILRSNVWDASYYSLAESLYPLLLLVVVVIFPYSKITEAAIIFAIVDLIQRSIGPIKEIASKIANIQRAISGLIRIEEFNQDLETLPKSSYNSRFESFDLERVRVEISHFSYPSRGSQKEFALENILFEGNKGDLIGIVGMSGCGKSTLLSILAGNIIPDKFQIELFSKDRSIIFCDDGPKELGFYKEQVGIVSQDSHLFSASLKFNITLGFKENEFGSFGKQLVCKFLI